MATSLDRTSASPEVGPEQRSPTRSTHASRGGAHLPTSLRRLAAAVGRHPAGALAAIAVALRLPLLHQAASADESGFLAVGAQWHAGGTSLYGNYWVDRPPLLITIFGLAAHTGGLVSLRLIGCLTVVLIILGVAHVARQLAGAHASAWAALAAAAWCVSPLLGTQAVNGELLAASFVIWGIAAMLHALRRRVGRRAALYAAASGGAFVAALLVKQNIADVGVFAAAATLLALRRGELTAREYLRIIGAFALGSIVVVLLVSAWTVLLGTSLRAVFDAMYPFRIRAGRVMAGASTHQAAMSRFWGLLRSWAFCGGAVALLVTAWALVSRRLHGTIVWALTATIVFEVVSVLLGGNYWNHYLIQLVGPLSVLIGVLAAGRRQLVARVVVCLTAIATLVAYTMALPVQADSDASRIGHSIATVSQPGDTIVTVYGHSEVTQSSGLSSPYPYLWSLPLKTLDPQLRLLDKVMSGPSAPTWFVTWSHLTTWGVQSGPASLVLAREYHPVAVLSGHTIYLHNGTARATPTLVAHASSMPALTPTASEEPLR